MAMVFPRMAKCDFQLFGPSGTIENRDVMCLLPTNIANEKIYMVIWFWLLIIAIIGGLWLLVRLLSFIPAVREFFFVLRYYTIPHRIAKYEGSTLLNKIASRDEVYYVLDDSNYSTYLLLCQLASNMDTTIFCEFLRYLARHIHQKDEQEEDTSDSGVDTIDRIHRQDTLPMVRTRTKPSPVHLDPNYHPAAPQLTPPEHHGSQLIYPHIDAPDA